MMRVSGYVILDKQLLTSKISHQEKGLKNEKLFNDVHSRLEMLGKKIHRFLEAVEKGHMSTK